MESSNDTETMLFTSCTNETYLEFPKTMQFNDTHRMAIILFSVFMFCSAVGNIYVLISILRRKFNGNFSRIDLLLFHLTVADLLVTFLMMPIHIGWNYTVSWQAGNFMCKLVLFLDIFGHYLTGFVVVVFSLDIYYAVVNPLGIAYADGRVKKMLVAAWIASFICSLPQLLAWNLVKSPKFECFEQCWFGLGSKMFNFIYIVFCITFLTVFPLLMIIFCYSCILYQVCHADNKKSTETQLRRSSTEALGRARVRTMKMSITIVTTFFLCWTPLTIVWLLFVIDSNIIANLGQLIQKISLLLICTNATLNPIIYGFFSIRRKQKANQSSAVGTSK
ncbi:Gonadotropin-releasing hormone II receptor [Orchesella cincta]|uniref:Gonadotropin-releasing hormone II receptor n=1 Tax=Orchesella cincta TaxID=48709 RepID=A0A1D2MGP5_ORCCI|nr:Gonadotropin-releasing hormone II receptor [Orchesella cincta]